VLALIPGCILARRLELESGRLLAAYARRQAGRAQRAGYAERQHAVIELLADHRRRLDPAVDDQHQSFALALGADVGELARAGLGKAHADEVPALLVDQIVGLGDVFALEHRLALQIEAGPVDHFHGRQVRRRVRLADEEGRGA